MNNMAEINDHISRTEVYNLLNAIGGCGANIETDPYTYGWDKAIDAAIEEIGKLPAVEYTPVKHGHIVWKEYHKGGIRRRKCLQEIKSAYIEQQMPCKQIAIIDERYLSKDPYCSECGKLLGEFLNYCGNCGAKMDGGDE